MLERRSARHARARQQPPAQAAALRRLTTVAAEQRRRVPPAGVGGWVPSAPKPALASPSVASDDAAADEQCAPEHDGSADDEDADVPPGSADRSYPSDLPAADGPPESPSTWLVSRFGLAPRHVVVVAVILLVALGLAGYALMRARPRDVPVPVSSTPPPSGLSMAAPPTATPDAGVAGAIVAVPAPTPTAVLLVDVVGRVRHPGVVRLPPGARVQDALAAAGGARKGVDLATLNLARPVVDGEQIAVGVRSRAPTTGGAVGPTPDTVIDLNTATLEQLETLPDVGPVTAQRILDFRTTHGRFSSVDDLREISGIGEKTFADIAPHVRV